MRHTVVIPSYNTLPHLKNTYESIKRYASDVDVIIIDDASNDGTSEWLKNLQDKYLEVIISEQRRGHTYWYDEGMRRAKTDIVSILHSDMIIGPGYFENLLKHLERGKVVCATRIEPPIHPAGKEKVIMNFGDDYDNFMWEAFEKFVISEAASEKDNTTRGIFAPWMVYKEDHLSIGGHDQIFAPFGYEDSDIFNRWILAGYKMVQSRDSFCYHMTCRGHRWNKGVGIENPDYRYIMDKNGREFIRKWGDWIRNDELQYPLINPKHNRGLRLFNSNLEVLHHLEPWFDNIYVDAPIIEEYIEKEQKNTAYDLSERVLKDSDLCKNDIVVRLDAKKLDQETFGYIQQLSQILGQHGETGTFELGPLRITIDSLEEYQESLIFI